jgi:ribosomal protein S21
MIKPIIKVKGNIERALKILKKDFELNVAPLLRRHQHYRSKLQIRREKHFLRVLGTKRNFSPESG